MNSTVLADQRRLYRSTFSVPKMDCPSEENLIRIALSSVEITKFQFDLTKREVVLEHTDSSEAILAYLQPLKLGAVLIEAQIISPSEGAVVPSIVHETMFFIPKMDCPSEENLIRMALANEQVQSLQFDLPRRTLIATHAVDAKRLLDCLTPLGLDAKIKETSSRKQNNTATRTVFSVPRMDCPSEENLIRMALQEFGNDITLSFDLAKRQLTITHGFSEELLLNKLVPLGFGASVLSSEAIAVGQNGMPVSEDAEESKTLRLLLAINGAMFIVEILLGMIAKSAGLVADSLDMFADAAVYGLALYAVGRAAHLKVQAAHIAGWLQMVLAIGALLEVMRRFVIGSEPASMLMMGIGLLALVANVSCLILISKKRDRGAHMKASYIFSANDVLANIGVIVAGGLVTWTGSPYPDLIIGSLIGIIVLNGARRILKLS